MKSFQSKNVALVCAAGIALSSCAQSSDEIQATYVSDVQYQNHTCEQLQEEYTLIRSSLATISAQQDEDADSDAVAMGVGLVLFWPALFVLAATEDEKEEIARLKGEVEALQRASLRQNCLLNFEEANPEEEGEDAPES